MSDPYFCYLKISGPDVAEFYRLLWKSEWVPRDPPYLMFSWSEPLHLDPSPTGKPPTKQVARIWYNTEVYVIQPRQPRTPADSDTLVNKLSQVVIRGNADSPLWAFAKTKPLSDEQVAAWQEINVRFFKEWPGHGEHEKQAHYNEKRRLRREVIGPHDPEDINTWLRYSYMPRVGPGLFDHLRLDVEMIGWMYSADTRSGKYSERIKLHNGIVLKDEHANSLRLAKKYLRKTDRE